jgi:hypothetical protein
MDAAATSALRLQFTHPLGQISRNRGIESLGGRHIMPAPRNPKKPSEMSHRELVSSLVAFTGICGVIDAFNVVSLIRRGFSLWAIAGLVFTSVILIWAWLQLGGELRRRRRGG